MLSKYGASTPGTTSILNYYGHAPLEELSLPLLEKALPGSRFYRTTLNGPPFCYPNVETVVVATEESGETRLETCVSPIFTDAAPTFLSHFTGLRAEGMAEQKAIGREFADMLSTITFEGSIKEPHVVEGVFRAQLLHRGRFWRLISIMFNDDRLASIRLTR